MTIKKKGNKLNTEIFCRNKSAARPQGILSVGQDVQKKTDQDLFTVCFCGCPAETTCGQLQPGLKILQPLASISNPRNKILYLFFIGQCYY
jgi:hypothetical protein